jgi:hypothetical protein
MQRGFELLKSQGLMSFIVSKTWLSLESFTALRKYILENSRVRLLAVPPEKTFVNATVETVIVVFEREIDETARKRNRIQIARFNGKEFEPAREIQQDLFADTHLSAFDLSLDDFTIGLNTKLQRGTLALEKCVLFYYGLKTGDDSKFLSNKHTTSQHKRLLRRSDFVRYATHWQGEYVWYVPDQMIQHRKTARPGDPERFESPKIMVLDIAKKIVATLDEEQYYVKDALLLLRDPNGPDLKYILGVLNSRLLNYYYAKTFTTLSVAKNAILTLPIRAINFDDANDTLRYRRIVVLVQQMLDLHKRFAAAQTAADREMYQRQIDATDTQIDALVYALYGLTEEEIGIVEEQAK